jgi:hypothetical protein
MISLERKFHRYFNLSILRCEFDAAVTGFACRPDSPNTPARLALLAPKFNCCFGSRPLPACPEDRVHPFFERVLTIRSRRVLLRGSRSVIRVSRTELVQQVNFNVAPPRIARRILTTRSGRYLRRVPRPNGLTREQRVHVILSTRDMLSDPVPYLQSSEPF